MDEVTLTYADGTDALRGLDLTVPRGEFFGFLGPNGAGKTTTVQILATLLQPTSGRVRVNGMDVTSAGPAVRGSIGYMPQETDVDEWLTAREHVRYACEAYGVPRGERETRIDELLDLVGLSEVADDHADQFSGGMKTRLDVAMALVHRPPLVFLDEPTTGLDPAVRNRLWEHFRRINDQGTTIFLTTQYLQEADELCDRIGVIREGRLVQTGSPSALKRRVGGDVLEIQVADGADPERVADILTDAGHVQDSTALDVTDRGISLTAPDAREIGPDLLVALRDNGVAVTGFDVRAPTLDDVFLAMTDGDSRVTDHDGQSAGGANRVAPAREVGR